MLTEVEQLDFSTIPSISNLTYMYEEYLPYPLPIKLEVETIKETE